VYWKISKLTVRPRPIFSTKKKYLNVQLFESIFHRVFAATRELPGMRPSERQPPRMIKLINNNDSFLVTDRSAPKPGSEILWRWRRGSPISCSRLRRGHQFLGMRQRPISRLDCCFGWGLGDATWGQFHHHLTGSFYFFPKSAKRCIWLDWIYMLLGSVCVSTAHKHFDEIDTWRVSFACQKLFDDWSDELRFDGHVFGNVPRHNVRLQTLCSTFTCAKGSIHQHFMSSFCANFLLPKNYKFNQ